jgi:hypothetical protein
MTHSLIYNAYIPDAYLVPYGEIGAAAVLISTKEFPDTVYVRIEQRAPKIVPGPELAAMIIGACVNHHYIVEYNDTAVREAQHVTKLLEMIEGVCV